MVHKIPDCDILIHAGDFTRTGSIKEVDEFSKFLASLTNIKHKIVIAGNHEVSFDDHFHLYNKDAKAHLNHCYYLEDSSTELYGYRFYGSPW